MGEVNLEDTIHLSDIKLPEGVESVELLHGAQHDQPVASIHLPRAAVEVEEEAPEAPAAEESSDDEASDD